MTKHLLIASIVCAATTALAQPAPPAPAPAPAPAPQAPGAPKTEEQKRAEAKSLYETGLSHYNLGEFDQAIAAFRAAYAISQAPGLLFNIGQSFRLKKDYEQATYFYTTYLRLKPDAPNRADVEERLKEMEQLIAEQKKLEQSKPIGTVPPDGGTTTQQKDKPEEKVPVVDEEKLRSGQTLMTASYVTAGAGGALVITGFIFGSLAKSAEKDLNGLGSGDTWTSEQQDRYDAGKRNNTIAIVSFIAGGAAIATGVTLYVMGTMKKKSATSVAVVPGAQGGATVHVGWDF